jgi:ribonucleoside-diphosphate reductase beta chain
LLDTYIADPKEREAAFAAIDNIPSIQKKAQFCFKWMDSVNDLEQLNTLEDKRKFLMNLICFATCIEGLFFFGAFAYVYFLRSKGLLNGLASGTNWVFRDESAHIDFAMEVIKVAREEEPALFDDRMNDMIKVMVEEAIQCELTFAQEILSQGLAGLSLKDMKTYLQFIADQRLDRLQIPAVYKVKNPFGFMELQDTQELTNFFERRVSAYQVGVSGDVSFDESF